MGVALREEWPTREVDEALSALPESLALTANADVLHAEFALP